MSDIAIKELIENMGPALRKNRERAAASILNNPDRLSQLMRLVFKTDYKLHYKSAWILEIILEKDLNYIVPHIDYFTQNIGKLQHESAIRPIAKICMWLAKAYVEKWNLFLLNSITYNNIEQLVETGFDWMITEVNVATQVYAMDTLYYLGTLNKIPELEWVHKELKSIILLNIQSKSAAYKARGRIILQKLK